MADAFSKIRDKIRGSEEVWKSHPAYYCWEPWDVEKRPPEVIEQAIKDGVDLGADYLMSAVGPDPHDFQTGFLMSEHTLRVIIAGGQVGKSVTVCIEILASATGEIPICMRYPKGHDTGVPRQITKENIIRWGRHSKQSGYVIDYDWKARKDDSWDCGNVTGVGIFPMSKIVPHGSTIRLGSYQRLILQNWWPAFTGESKSQLGKFVPPQFIDKTRGGSAGSRGYNVQNKQVFLLRGVTLQMLTYEAKKEGFEGMKVPTYLDEEPPDQDIIGTVVTHSSRWSIITTPYLGITYLKDLAFPKVKSSSRKTFHATAYDCPYLGEQELEEQRDIIGEKIWEIGARLWGIPTAQTGEPYYDRVKINLWLQRFQDHIPYQLVTFQPTAEWQGIKTDMRSHRHPGLLDTPVGMTKLSKDDQQSAWRLYEDRQSGVAYCCASDQATGADTPDAAGDFSTAVIGRASEEDPERPVIVATLRSTLPTPQFAREVLYAARYFNNMLLAPEYGRGAANESFKMIAADWPYWFKDVTKRQSNRKAQVQLGFCPTVDRRDAVFNVLIRDWLDAYNEDEYPDIPDEWILREASDAVHGTTRGGADRCDHPKGGTIDSLMAYGILLFVFQKEYNHQIRCNGGDRPADKVKSWIERMQEATRPERPVFLGAGVKKLR